MKQCPYNFDLMNAQTYVDGVSFDDLTPLRWSS